MKKIISLLIILIVSLIVVFTLLRSQKPEYSDDVSSKDSSWHIEIAGNDDNSTRGNAKTPENRNVEDVPQEVETDLKISDKKLKAYAKAFVAVQAYLQSAGSSAKYEESTSIVRSHGMSVEDYTRISTEKNRDPVFRERVLQAIKEIENTSR